MLEKMVIIARDYYQSMETYSQLLDPLLSLGKRLVALFPLQFC